MKRLLIAGLLALPCYSLPITFSTSGLFSGPDATAAGSQLTVGATTIRYVPPTGNPLHVDAPTNITLGWFTSTTASDAIVPDVFPSTGSDTFTLSILQVSPAAPSGSYQPLLIQGTVTPLSSSIVLSFTGAPLSLLSGYEQTIYSLPNSVNLVSNGQTTLQAYLSVIPSPEPGTLGVLAFSGVLLFASGLIRKRQTRK